MALHRIRTVPVLAAGAALAIGTAAQADPAGFDGPETLRVYMIGNSLTDTVRYGDLEDMAESRGHEHIWGRDMIPGAPLTWHWDNPYNGGWGENQQAPGNTDGHWPEALSSYTWDAITLQSTDYPVNRDFDWATRFINVLKQHPGNLDADGKVDTQVYIYAQWPRRTSDGDGGYEPFDFQSIWDETYTGAWGSTRNRDFWQALVDTLNDPDSVGQTDPGSESNTILTLPDTVTYGPEGNQTTIDIEHPATLLNKPVRLIPAGDVIYELQNRLAAEPDALALYGIGDVTDLYEDASHFNDFGSFLVASTYFAVLYGEDPVGLPSEGYGNFTSAYVDLVQDTVWDVVNGHAYTGVNVVVPEPTSAALLLGAGVLTLRRRR